jgi:hypothetical protein
MALNLSADCTFTGPALPEPFVKFNLEAELNRLALLPKSTGAEGRALDEHWKFVRRKLGALVSHGGGLRVQNHVIEPLLAQLSYARIETVEAIQTREGAESGGALLITEDGTAKLRVWCVDLDSDLDAPARRGLAYRFSHTRIAQRVLLATGERLGILTNGLELRILISDPARVDSQVAISVDPHWKRSRDLPDSVRLLIALASPAGVKALPELIDKARLQQAKVTKDLREQARSAIREFIQELLDHPDNKSILAEITGQVTNTTSAANRSPSPPSEWGEGRGEVGTLNHQPSTLNQHDLARALWHEGLITVYRLLFILKLESTDDPARSFSFASTSLWRNTFSPTVALAPIVRRVLDHGAQTGRLLQDGLRALFRMLSDGLQCTELNVRPMAGALFAPATTPILGRLQWSETAIAKLLDNLLWTRSGRGATARERVHYGPLDVEDLGRVYEALLELEPGITAETMCRLRRAKLEVVVPAAQGERYKPVAASRQSAADLSHPSSTSQTDDDTEDEEEEETSSKKTKVEWIEEIPTDRFYLRVGLGRKATGSFYTPHSFVRFLVRETLGPLVQRVSPADDPQPCAILKLKVIDKAMGSGHFLVESCRFLGEALYDAARRCDELAAIAEKSADAFRKSNHADQAAEQESRAAALRQRVIDLPDPDDELLRYLPSRSVEGTAGGVSHNKAIALCRRMVAVHCLYGVDKNPLAVELAKLALWIECHAEGLPLTFLDHRLVIGDSLTGPFFEHLLKYPGSQLPLDDLFTQGLTAKLTAALADALQHVRALEATVGVTVADIEAKQAAKVRLDRALAPFKILAAAWSGGVMLGTEGCDDTAYAALAKLIAETGKLPDEWLAAVGNRAAVALLNMIAKGLGLPSVPADGADIASLIARLSANAIPALSFDLAFPEVFYPDGNAANRVGFDADLGNPPWDAILFKTKEFLAAFDFAIMDAPTKKERERIEKLILADAETKFLFDQYKEVFEELKRANDALYTYQKVQIEGDLAGRQLDAFRVFMERSHQVLRSAGVTGVVVPSAFHSNEGAAGVRQLYLRLMSLRCCYSFENKRKLFEIHSSFKFATVVAEKGIATSAFPCAFYLHDDKWLFTENRKPEALTYTRDFISKTGGEHLAFVELRTSADLDVCNKLFEQSESFAKHTSREKMQFQTQPVTLHMTKESHRFVPTGDIASDLGDVRQPEGRAALIGRAAFYLSEGKTFHQFDELWGESPRYCVPISKMSGNPLWVKSGRHYRLCFRSIASSTNERTSIFCLLSPGTLSGNSIAAEREPEKTPRSKALVLAAFCNAHAFDWVLRVMTSSNVNLFIMNNTPVAITPTIEPFLAHNALRLTCTHAGYAPLWREQLGEAWREAGAVFTWPVLSGDAARWAVRAAIDAVVAHAYGLTRDQYAHVLSTFSHSSYKDAPRQCLAAFDELQSLGLEAFTKQHDPYWNIPLNENLPQPVIDLPIPVAAPGETPRPRTAELFDFRTTAAPPGSGELFAEQPSAKRRQTRKRG